MLLVLVGIKRFIMFDFNCDFGWNEELVTWR